MNTHGLALFCSITAVTLSGQAQAFVPMAPLQGDFSAPTVQLVASQSAKCQEAYNLRSAHRDKVTDEERRRYNRYYNRKCKSKKARRASKKACKAQAKANGLKFDGKTFSFTDRKTGDRYICSS